MNCAFDKEKLSAFYDGELAAAEKAEVERHIASCSECLRDLGELKSAALLIKELPRLRAPQSIAQGVSREIQAAGKVHVLSRFRRIVLWSSAAAAGLFIAANVVYLVNAGREMSPAASRPLGAPLAQSAPSADEPRAARALQESDRATSRDSGVPMRREAPADKSAPEAEAKRDAFKQLEESRKDNLAKAAKEAGAAEAPAKSAEPATPAPVTAAPAAPAAKPAAKPQAPAGEELAEKSVRKETEQIPPKPEADLKAKVAAAPAPAPAPAAAVGGPTLAPVQYNVVTTQIAKARPRIEDSLKKMGVTVPVPPPKPTRNREAENTLVLELTDAQLLKLRDELEKPGDARMVVASPVEPVLPGFRSGGLYGAKKEAAGGGKPAPAAKDLKDEDAKAPAEAPPEPRRRVTLHLVEQKNLPPAEGDAVPPQKN